MLVLALVIIVVVSVAGVAVLNQQQSAPTAQNVYTKVETMSTNADAAAQSAINELRYSARGGITSHADPSITSPQWPCHDESNYTPLNIGSQAGGLSVYCKADPTSGKLANDQASPPGTAVLAFGGSNLDSNVTGAVPNWQQLPPGSAAAAQNAPFCADYPSAGGNNCEAGVYVGRNTANNATDPGGVVIASNGSLSGDALVVSNGSIIVNRSKQPHTQTLTAEGLVQTRLPCGSWNKNLNYPFAAASDGSVVGSSAPTCCPDGLAPPGNASIPYCLNNGTPYEPLTADADLVHEPIDLSQLPRVDSGAAAPYTLSAASLCAAGGDGMVNMPAKDLGVKEDGVEVYGACYDSAQDLQDVMDNCTDSLFYFRPGVYYFDFQDPVSSSGFLPAWFGGTKTKWGSPKGCFPAQSCAWGMSEIMGGTPNVDPVTNEAAWKACNCRQPTKVAEFEHEDPNATKPWNGTLPETMTIDGEEGQFPIASGHMSSTVSMKYLQTPLPQVAGHFSPPASGLNPNDPNFVTVQAEIGYTLPTTTSSFKAAPNDPAKRAGAELQVTLTDTAGKCDIYLPLGDHDSVVGTSTPKRVDQVAGAGSEYFDLSKGCDQTSLGTNYEKAGTGIFAPGTWSGWTPALVNQIKLTFTITGVTGTKSTIGLDGMQVDASYVGRPAPAFPNGCDSSQAGVQFILGNRSRIDWGSGNHENYVELCATRQDKFPNWDNDPNWTGGANCNAAAPAQPAVDPCQARGQGHQYGVAIYGMAEGTEGGVVPACVSTTAVNTAGSLADSSAPSGGPACASNTMGVSTTTHSAEWLNSNPADYSHVGGNASQAEWSNGNTATLTYTIDPNLVCAYTSFKSYASGDPGCSAGQIPYGSTITDAQITLVHNEGAYNGAAYVKGTTEYNAGNLQLKITPGSTNMGSNGYKATLWNSATDAAVNSGNGIPLCNVATNPSTSFCTWTWGDRTETVPPGLQDNQNPNPDWSLERNPTDAVSSPEGWAGATVSLTMNAPGDALKHELWLDALQIKLTYRPTGSLRPLGGCATTRAGVAPGTILPAASGYSNSHTPPADPHYDWLDADWGINADTGASAYQSDEPYTDFGQNGANAGNSAASDKVDCAVFASDATSGVQKTHIQGMLYTPSAAIFLTGNDNDASWSTMGVWAREITAFRYTNGGGIPAIGPAATKRNPRRFTLEVCDQACTNPGAHVSLRTFVEVDDTQGLPIGTDNNVKVLSWTRNAS